MTIPTTNLIRVLLVDDHVLVRAGLRMLIESYPGLVVVGEAANRADTLACAARERPDIILLDLDLAGTNSLDFLPELVAVGSWPSQSGGARVIVLAGVPDPKQHHQAVRLGAVGVVLKDQAPAVLIKAIEKVHAGEVWIDRSMMASVLAEMSRPQQDREIDPEEAKIAGLTERERDVIALICEGLQNKYISERLTISETTVRHHLTSIFDKLGVENRLELVIYAYRQGLAKPPG